LHGREEGVEATILTEKFRWHPEPGRANNHPVGGGCSSQNGVPRKALLSSQDIGWSSSEKKIARRAFDAALDTALAAIIAEFKRRAAAATTSDEMWDMEDYLRRQRRQIEETFDIAIRSFRLSLRDSYPRATWTKRNSPACRMTSCMKFGAALRG
jgi:Photoprotection regulator fluorescence recovery protein